MIGRFLWVVLDLADIALCIPFIRFFLLVILDGMVWLGIMYHVLDHQGRIYTLNSFLSRIEFRNVGTPVEFVVYSRGC